MSYILWLHVLLIDTYYDKVCQKFSEFSQLDDVEKLPFLFTFDDAHTLPWLGKYLHKNLK